MQFRKRAAVRTNTLRARNGFGCELLEQRRVLAASLSLAGPSEAVFEGESARFTLTLSEPLKTAERVFITTTPGTAAYGSDYFAPARTQILFSPGQVTKTFSITTLRDAGIQKAEGIETFFVTATPATAGLGSRSSTVSIVDYAPPPGISVNDVTVTERDSGTTVATFTVNLSKAYAKAVTVAFATRDGSATTANSDYVATSGVLTFAPGETKKTVDVTIIGDRKLEPDETFSIVLSSPTRGILSKPVGICTIVNDEQDQIGFQISVTYLTPMEPAWTRAVERAVARWQSVIIGDVPGVEHNGQFIDDFEINVSFERLPPNLLGGARFTAQRPGTGGLPYRGEMTMNSLYANQAGIYDTVVHELAHALGFSPTLWEQLKLNGGTAGDPRFLGVNAVREFNSIFSRTDAGVPLYEVGQPGDGSYGAHWRDSLFGNEMMVSAGDPSITNVPLSRITVAHFADIGYTVNYAAADAYARPPSQNASRDIVANAVSTATWASLAGRPTDHGTNRPAAGGVPVPLQPLGQQQPSTAGPRPETASQPSRPRQAPAKVGARPVFSKPSIEVVAKRSSPTRIV